MRVWPLFVASLILSPLATVAGAQEAPLDGVEIRASGEAYANSIRFRGVNANVGYFDPTRPAPPLDTRETPRQPREVDEETVPLVGDAGQVTVILICAAILLFVAYMLVVHGGRMPVSFSRSPEDGAQEGAARTGPNPEADSAPLALKVILAMPDKRAALVALCKSLLAQTVAAQGVLFQRSWTDREALRRVPFDFEHRDALHALVLESERVQFGGRDVTAPEFDAHVDRVRPIWVKGAP
ncbi:MAG: DUF4129 domain-containing protein [Pseudomonadota bacterium]